MDGSLALSALALAAAMAYAVPKAQRRLELSLAKHPSLTGHSRMAKRVAGWLPGYAYDEGRFFDCDGAPAELGAQRRAGLQRLAALYRQRYAKTLALSAQAAEGIADLQFTGVYRVPFQFSPVLRRHLKIGSFMAASSGVSLTDLDGNTFIDLTGSYGVNVFGHDFYKACIAEGSARGRSGPGAGQLPPGRGAQRRPPEAVCPAWTRCFHMSGTEAVMQAVRLARYPHAGRTWCASAAPTTAGGRTCSPAPATRCPRARPTRSRRCTPTRCACCASAATSPACW
jgi:glutamate-1-semialdehyde 2,1-aminomutase